MKIFYGGQILEGLRGELSLIITRSESGGHEFFLPSAFDDEAITLTGTRAVRNPVERVYVGISHDAGEDALKEISFQTGETTLSEENLARIDRRLVTPYFLTHQ